MALPDNSFEVFFDLVATRVVLYAPIYGNAGVIVDFALVRLNQAAQRFLGLPAQPAITFRQQYPPSVQPGLFAWYCAVFLAGETKHYEVSYQVGGTETGLQLVAQRNGAWLAVHFMDCPGLPHPAKETSHASPAWGQADVGETQQVAAQSAELFASTQRQAQERNTYYQIFAQTPAAVCIQRGPEHRFEYVNVAYQQLFPGRRLLGLPVVEAQPEIVGTGLVELLDHVYQTGETYHGEEMQLAIVQAEGEPIKQSYFTFTYQAYRENDRIVGISTFAVEVTEQVLARQGREEERQQLLRLFRQAPVGICILAGPELLYEFVNPSYQLLLPNRTLQGLPILQALPELAGTAVEKLLRQVYQTGQMHQELAMLVPVARLADGVLEDRYFTFVYQARRNEQQQVDGIMIFTFEVSEQVQSQQAAEASAQQLQVVTDALPVLISYLDHAQIYRFANRAYESWFHFTPAQLVGRHPRQVVGEEAYQQSRAYIERALTGEAVEYDARMDYANGLVKYVHTSLVPDIQAGKVAGFFALIVDVTGQVEARKTAEASAQQAVAMASELHEANQQLVHTNADLDNFIYSASHDLKAPIANIESLLLLLRRQLPADVRQQGLVPRVLAMIQESVERFGRTIGHLTDISRLQQEYRQPASQVRLLLIVQEVQLDLAYLITQTNAQLVVAIPEAITLTFSEKNLRSVVYNLLSNAIKYQHPGRQPLVHVQYRQQEAYHVLEVQDNGLGLDLAQGQEKLFGLFQRLHTHVEGTGIGLYMAKKMVESAGGHIEVQSQLDQGTRFCVYLPL